MVVTPRAEASCVLFTTFPRSLEKCSERTGNSKLLSAYCNVVSLQSRCACILKPVQLGSNWSNSCFAAWQVLGLVLRSGLHMPASAFRRRKLECEECGCWASSETWHWVEVPQMLWDEAHWAGARPGQLLPASASPGCRPRALSLQSSVLPIEKVRKGQAGVQEELRSDLLQARFSVRRFPGCWGPACSPRRSLLPPSTWSALPWFPHFFTLHVPQWHRLTGCSSLGWALLPSLGDLPSEALDAGKHKRWRDTKGGVNTVRVAWRLIVVGEAEQPRGLVVHVCAPPRVRMPLRRVGCLRRAWFVKQGDKRSSGRFIVQLLVGLWHGSSGGWLATWAKSSRERLGSDI